MSAKRLPSQKPVNRLKLPSKDRAVMAESVWTASLAVVGINALTDSHPLRVFGAGSLALAVLSLAFLIREVRGKRRSSGGCP